MRAGRCRCGRPICDGPVPGSCRSSISGLGSSDRQAGLGRNTARVTAYRTSRQGATWSSSIGKGCGRSAPSPAPRRASTRTAAGSGVAGLVITRQAPSTAGKIRFFTLEDEDGHVNVTIKSDVYQRYRREAAQPILVVDEVVQSQDGIWSLLAHCHRPAAARQLRVDPLARLRVDAGHPRNQHTVRHRGVADAVPDRRLDERSGSGSAGSPTSGWLRAFSSTVLPVDAVYIESDWRGCCSWPSPS